MSKILIIGRTHGHEKIGLRVIEELSKLNLDINLVDFEVGNPKASEKNIPFIESDLNRVFPGKEYGTYEEMRAFELSQKILSADVVIDIHSTNTTDLSEKSMLIVTKYDEAIKEIIDIINPPKVLYMKYKGGSALISQAKIGIAFEYGKDISEKVLIATLYDIANILLHFKIIDKNPYENIKPEIKTETFEVYDVFKKTFTGDFTLDKSISNFKLIKKDFVVCTVDMSKEILADEDFVPILFGKNRYNDILGFKAKKI